MIVKYRRLYPYAPYLNEEIGYERSIPDDSTEEEMIEATSRLKEVADKCHEKFCPHQVPISEAIQGVLPEVQVEKHPVHNRIDELVADINSCTDIKVLESYRIIARANQPLQEAYNKRLKELS